MSLWLSKISQRNSSALQHLHHMCLKLHRFLQTCSLLHLLWEANQNGRQPWMVPQRNATCTQQLQTSSTPLAYLLVLQGNQVHQDSLLVKCVHKGYQPPRHEAVQGKLLDISYNHAQRTDAEMLKKDASIFGIAFFGDGATVRKMPLFNILASSAFMPSSIIQTYK